MIRSKSIKAIQLLLESLSEDERQEALSPYVILQPKRKKMSKKEAKASLLARLKDIGISHFNSTKDFVNSTIDRLEEATNESNENPFLQFKKEENPFLQFKKNQND